MISSVRFDKNIILTASLSFLLFFLIGMILLYRSHPYEDAFIVFKYAENLAKGNGLVYYPGGPHAEGYVDFLWVAVLSGLIRLGFDVAVAGLLINALGAALIAGIFSYYLRDFPRLFKLIPFAVLFSSAALASYGGFSTLMHVAIAVLGFSLCLSDKPALILLLPFVSLVSALYRADGAVIGFGLSVSGLVLAGQKGIYKKYLQNLVIAAALGFLYFFLRVKYFGLLLPLPLYVKNQGLAFGLSQNLIWLKSASGPLPILLGMVVLSLFTFRKISIGRILLALLPAGFLFASLCMADQLQNLYARFQSPIYFLLFGVFIKLSSDFLKTSQNSKRVFVLALIWLIALIPMMRKGALALKQNYFYQPVYADTFSKQLALRIGRGQTFALTEAGRLAYWSDARIEDLIGLNTAYTALRPPNQKYFQDLNADLLMCQHMGLLDLEMLEKKKKENDVLISISQDEIREAVVPKVREMLEKDFDAYQRGEDRSVLSVMALIRYLVQNQNYDLWLAPYRSMHRPLRYWHLYAVRKDLPEKENILSDLREAVTGNFKTYAQLKNFWLA